MILFTFIFPFSAVVATESEPTEPGPTEPSEPGPGEVPDYVENPDDNFDHLKDIVEPDALNWLNSLTQQDKIYLITKIMSKMDVDQDEQLEPQEIHSWMHYLEQNRVINDAHGHVCYYFYYSGCALIVQRLLSKFLNDKGQS